ncbi:MAG: hypothetical protein ACLP2Y_15965 [Limisphaerales bacterium]
MVVQTLAKNKKPRDLAGAKIAHIFGAGAIHAEIVELYRDEASEAKFPSEDGLLIDAVSKQVCEQARSKEK